jgi:adenosylcobinamide-GDP ribazoletransferase
MRGWLRRRLGGYTGDTLGACEQLGEIVVALVFVAAWTPWVTRVAA